MKIYAEEKALAEQIKQDTSISYILEPQEASDSEIDLMMPDREKISTAGIKDNDLFFHKSILVTTSWNANDDVFSPAEVWPARNTPMHKPTNLNHQSSKIVGHMTGNWAITADGKIIDEDTAIDELPSKFHILNGAVIYKKYHNNKEYEEQVHSLIEEILAKKQFVSMECGFNDFDYALQSTAATGSGEKPKIKLVTRNEETAFLTKHLRAYGGEGIYENHKVGRVLKNITFIGKAYTPTPANKESVIFTESDMFDFANATREEALDKKIEKNTGKSKKTDGLEKRRVISLSKTNLNGDNSMSEAFEKQIAELSDDKKSLAKQVEDLKDQLTKADVAKHQEKVSELESTIQSLQESLSKKEDYMKEKEEEAKKAKADLDEATKQNKTLADKLQTIEVEKAKADRVSYLVDSKIDREDAVAKVELFSDLSDEQFKAVADTLIKAASSVEGQEAPASDPKEADASELEASSTDEDAATAASTEQEPEDKDVVTVASLAEKIQKTFKNNK